MRTLAVALVMAYTLRKYTLVGATDPNADYRLQLADGDELANEAALLAGAR